MRKKGLKISLLIGLLILMVFFGSSYAGKIKVIAILPFSINAAQDFTFLKEGIMDMLRSRLARKGEVEILEKGKVKEKVAELKGSLNKEKALLLPRFISRRVWWLLKEGLGQRAFFYPLEHVDHSFQRKRQRSLPSHSSDDPVYSYVDPCGLPFSRQEI